MDTTQTTLDPSTPITCERDARYYLTRRGTVGHLRTFSRFGQTTDECVEAAYLVALVHVLEDGRVTMSGQELDDAMGLVVNDADGIADLLTYGAQVYGFDLSNIDGLEV
jgi:hypothetical protein